jgi:aryl-alcohol dehydrogenase-like predicted oxidoreductase
MTREEAAVRFPLSHPGVTSAIIGLARAAEVAQAIRHAQAGPLDASLVARLNVS